MRKIFLNFILFFSSAQASANSGGTTLFSPSEIGIMSVCLLFLIGPIISYLLSGQKCPKCKAKKVETLNVTELDRFKGVKKVYDQKGKNTHTRHIQTTYVKNKYEFKCNQCGHEWESEVKEELR